MNFNIFKDSYIFKTKYFLFYNNLEYKIKGRYYLYNNIKYTSKSTKLIDKNNFVGIMYL